ncbi:MAG: hypothetical protein Q9191_004412 [Dirinaria sp. TL-2023a]
MTSKAAKAAIPGGHTAGIFADMTVDGPEIGTLVVVADRAKNLPNRKTMGKQDPYCAARLGKEAKKTDTDRRGGQTPKWDQEMRFTVHDSPDYYQLKVSVFNDDRKTELIGETWVALEKIIVPGGGQNDLWHQLNCKGRFAGEIRIELTYYDTRPKEPRLEERRQSSTVNGTPVQDREGSVGLNGPRQPKPVKRRPLPADPTMPDPNRSSPQPYTPPPINEYLPNSQQQSPAPSPAARMDATTPLNHHYEQIDPRASPSNLRGYSRAFPGNERMRGQTPEYLPFNNKDYAEEVGIDGNEFVNDNRQNDYAPVEDQVQGYSPYSNGPFDSHGDMPSPSTQDYGYPVDDYQSPLRYEDRPSIQSLPARRDLYGSSPPKPTSLPQHASMPDVRAYPDSSSNSQQYHRTSLPNIENSEQLAPRHQSLDAGRNACTNSNLPVESDGPPPPPAHRSNGLQSAPQFHGRGHAESYPPISGPPPLNIRNARNSISASPLSQVQTSTPNGVHHSSQSPSARMGPQAISSRPPHGSYSQPDRRRSPEHFSTSPVRDYNQSTPPSLVPGYDPRIAEDESERLMFENQSSMRQASEPAPQYQAFAVHNTQSRAHPSPRYVAQVQNRSVDDANARRPHRASAPVVPRREVSPDSRRPTRKSVSPQPEAGSAERQQSVVPFGPDSYDVFNPTLNEASDINSSGPKYSTPEQSREALYEHEREAKLAEGPIIGTDGRVIDPSDHLPAETWAPEPETKTPKKKPEITVRFRRSPAGAQPMPTSARRTVAETSPRPNPLVTPAYAHSSDPVSPTSAARSRLLKKSRQAMAQPASSPAVPTINTNARMNMPRSNASDYPLREPENYGYGGSSPTYARSSPGGVPPPVPGKVPLSAGTGQEDWGMSALSEEMRRIDIGVGGGQGRPRRSRYGNS